MAILLRIIDGPQAGGSCELREGQRIVLGRGEQSDFHVLDSWASRLHCAITCQPDGIIVEDLQTKNGTYVGGRAITKARVPDGSLIQIGTTTVQVLTQATRVTVAAFALPLHRRTLRVGLYAGASLVLLLGIAYGALLIVGGIAPGRKPGGGGVSRVGPKKPAASGVFSLFGPRTVAIDVTSEPPGATVFIDDEFLGATPLAKLELSPGEHVLRIQKAGYEVHRAPLDLSSRPAGPVHVVLKLAERGSLVIHSKPEGASVYLDGEYRGNTPLTIKDLEPQAYSLRLSMTNFADWHQEVAVKPTEAVTVEAVLGHREIVYYEAELKKDPNNVSYHTEVAHLYLLDQKTDPCIQHLTQAIEITIAERDTTQPEPYTARLIWLLQKIYFNDYFVYGDEAFVQRTQGRIDAMLADLASRHPDSSAIHSTAEKLYKRAGTSLLDKAALFEEKAKAQPAELSHTLNAVGFLILARENLRAEELLRKACAAYTADHQAYLALGRFYIGARRRGVQGAREKAIEALNAALQRAKSEDAKVGIRRLLGEATD